jgi:hypothetical protein
MMAMKRRTHKLDQALFLVSFMAVLGLLFYTARSIRSHGLLDLTRPLLFLLSSLLPGFLFLFRGIALVITYSQSVGESAEEIPEDEPGDYLRGSVTLLIYGSILLLVALAGSLVLLNFAVRR